VLLDKQPWWDAPNYVRIPTGIVVALLLALRFYGAYRGVKNAPRRSPRVRRIERIVAISLWSFIAAGVAIILLARH
jgi:hypothetical protein